MSFITVPIFLLCCGHFCISRTAARGESAFCCSKIILSYTFSRLNNFVNTIAKSFSFLDLVLSHFILKYILATDIARKKQVLLRHKTAAASSCMERRDNELFGEYSDCLSQNASRILVLSFYTLFSAASTST